MKVSLVLLALGLTMSAGGCSSVSSPAAPALEGASPALGAESKSVVIAFYKLGLEDRQPKKAFARFVAPNFIEHAPDSPGGTAEASMTFLDDMIAKMPQARWELIRSAAEGDLVFLHTRFTPEPGGPEIAIAEVFRVQDGKIAEHWDVISGPPEKVVNPNSRF